MQTYAEQLVEDIEAEFEYGNASSMDDFDVDYVWSTVLENAVSDGELSQARADEMLYDPPYDVATAVGEVRSSESKITTADGQEIGVEDTYEIMGNVRGDSGTDAGAVWFEVDSAVYTGEEIAITADIMTEGFGKIGHTKIDLQEGGGVYAALMEIDAEYQGHGAATVAQVEGFQALKDAGFDHLTVSANITVGGYTWASSEWEYDWDRAGESGYRGLLDSVEASAKVLGGRVEEGALDALDAPEARLQSAESGVRAGIFSATAGLDAGERQATVELNRRISRVTAEVLNAVEGVQGEVLSYRELHDRLREESPELASLSDSYPSVVHNSASALIEAGVVEWAPPTQEDFDRAVSEMPQVDGADQFVERFRSGFERISEGGVGADQLPDFDRAWSEISQDVGGTGRGEDVTQVLRALRENGFVRPPDVIPTGGGGRQDGLGIYTDAQVSEVLAEVSEARAALDRNEPWSMKKVSEIGKKFVYNDVTKHPEWSKLSKQELPEGVFSVYGAPPEDWEKWHTWPGKAGLLGKSWSGRKDI